jgi:hypothetical protein
MPDTAHVCVAVWDPLQLGKTSAPRTVHTMPPPGRRPPMVSALRPSVQFLFPVRRHQTRRSRGWLIQRVVGGRHELGPVICLFGSEVPEPVLAWLKALHELVAALLVVQTRVLRRRGVTTTHMPAPRAAAKMKPPPASFGALQTPVPTRRNCGINAADLAHDQRLGRRHTTSQGSPAEADVAPQGHRLDRPPLLPMFLRARGTTPFPIPHGVGHTVAVNACTGGSRGSIILPILLLVVSEAPVQHLLAHPPRPAARVARHPSARTNTRALPWSASGTVKR